MISPDKLSSFGIGTGRSASLGNRLKRGEFKTFLEEALAHRVNLLDTSNFYGTGDAERLIGKAMRLSGGDFFVITKAGLPSINFPGWVSPLNQFAKKWKQRRGTPRDYSASHLIDSVRHSNKRLGRVPDGFLLHEPRWEDIEGQDTWEGLRKIREQGLARFTGASTSDLRVIEEGIRHGQVQLVQTHSVWGNPDADAIMALCRRHGIPVILNGVMEPFQRLGERYSRKAAEIHQLEGLEGMSLVHFLFAASVIEKQAAAALSGTTSLEHLRHNLGMLRYLEALPRHLPAVTRLLE